MYPAQHYLSNIRGDLLGGLTAGIVALPLALAFGIASGAGPVAGLYGAIILGLFAAIFGGTPSQISGPTGPMTVIMTAMIAQFSASYPDSGLALAFTTVMLAGCLQMLLGMLRLGKYIVMVPYPVISGFMTGIGVIIIVLQLGPLLGFAAYGNVNDALRHLPQQLSGINGYALATGALTLLIVFAWRGRVNNLLPSPLLALIVAGLAAVFLLPAGSVATIGEIPSALPSLQLPAFEPALLQTMLVNAAMLAVLGSIDSLLTSLVADNITSTLHHSDRELIGQGLGNAVCGLLGGLPGAGATMRTLVNIRAGGQGPLSGVSHALVLLVVVVGLGGIFGSIPLAALAGILIKVGIDIIDWPFFRRIHHLPLFPVALTLLVMTLTVFVDLITAVFIGVFIKNAVTINKLSDLELGSVIMSDGEQDADRLPLHERQALQRHAGKAVLIRVTGPLSYAVARGLSSRFEPFRNHHLLLIDIASAPIIGISTLMAIEDLIRQARAGGGQVKLIGKLDNPESRKMGIAEMVGAENCIETVSQALAG